MNEWDSFIGWQHWKLTFGEPVLPEVKRTTAGLSTLSSASSISCTLTTGVNTEGAMGRQTNAVPASSSLSIPSTLTPVLNAAPDANRATDLDLRTKYPASSGGKVLAILNH